jgi:glycopeptide antibiotics resistance protein
VRELAAWSLVGYLALLLVLTFYPFGGSGDLSIIEVRLKPFETIRGALRLGEGSREFGVLIGNVVAFMPIGFLLPVFVERRRWLVAMGGGFLLSVAIETVQLAISVAVGFTYRIADVDDVIVNTLGAVLGFGIFAGADAVRGWFEPAG